MWNEKKPSTRFTSSQLPALPPIVTSPRQQLTTPNKAHPTGDPPREPETHKLVSGGGRSDGTKLMQLESRVGILEHANQALLEELVQIQAEMKKKQLQQEEVAEVYRREMERMQLSLESKTNDLEHRVLQNERNIDHGQNAVSALVRSSQDVERGVLSSQVEMFSRKDQLLVHLEHVKDDLRRLDQKCLQIQETVSHEQSNMAEAVRKMRGSWDVQTAGTESNLSNLRQHIKRLELEEESLVEGLGRVEAAIGRLENTDVQLKRHLDSKVSDLGAGFIELRGLITHLENERKRQEVWLKESFSHVQEQMSWFSQKTTDSFQSLTTELENKGEHMAAECARLASRLSTALEENGREIWENTQKTRDLFEIQIGGLEKALHSEHEACCNRETEVNNKMSTQWEEFQTKITDQISELKSTMERERQGTQHSLSALNGSISLLDRERKLDKDYLFNVLNAEIKTRQEEVMDLQERISRVQEVCRESLESLREALLSLDKRVATDGKEVQLLQQRLTEEWQEMGRRMLSDVSARMSALHEHIDTASADTSSKEPEKQPREVVDAELHRQQLLEQQRQWQTMMNGQMDALQRQVQHNSNCIHQMTTGMHEMRLKLQDLIQHETNERFHSVHSLKNQIANLQTLIPVLPPHPGNYSQQPLPTRYFQPNQAIGTMVPHLEVMEQQLHRSRQRTGTEHSHPATMPRPQGASKGNGRYFDPTMGTHPFQEYNSDDESQEEEENASESEGSNEEDIPMRDHLETSLVSESGEEYLPRDQFETSPEPRSVHSSVSRHYPKRSKMPPARAKAPQRYRTHERHHPPLSQFFENTETQGTFTSAAPTPDNLQQVLLRPRSEADSGGEQDEDSRAQLQADPSPSLEGPPEFQGDQYIDHEGQSVEEATSLDGDHVDSVADDENRVDSVADDGNHIDNGTDDGNPQEVVGNLRGGENDGEADESIVDTVPLVTGSNEQDNTET